MATIGTAFDITERKEAEERLLSYQSQLQSLASELSLTEQYERRRLATYLHDYIGQTLALCRIKLGTLPEEIVSQRLNKHLAEIRTLLEQMITNTQSLTFELSPPVLYELDFEDAIEWLIDQMQEQQEDIEFIFEDDKQPKTLSNDFRILMFNSVRELLVNCIKHSRATRVVVSLARWDGRMKITVNDNGIGLVNPPSRDHQPKKGGFGLFNIRERLSYLGGEIEIDSGEEAGTRVTLIAPLVVTYSQTGQET